MIVSLSLWWVTASLLRQSTFNEYTFWLSLPFWFIGALAILGIFNIGPLGKDLTKAIVEDNEEQKNNLHSKQPWENK